MIIAGEEIAAIHLGKALPAHFLDVGARRKGLLAAGDDQAALRSIGIIGGKGGDQIGQHLGVQRIQRLRAIEAHQRDGAALFHKDGFKAHRGYPIVGMTNALPPYMPPSGQRPVTVLRLVQNCTPSMPCWPMSPKALRFQPPKL